jgi:hypothetical protein
LAALGIFIDFLRANPTNIKGKSGSNLKYDQSFVFPPNLAKETRIENMAPNTKIFSLEGKGLKLDTKEDVEVHIKGLREMEDVEEIRLLGNTLGVEACKVLGEVLETKKTLQVYSACLLYLNTESLR